MPVAWAKRLLALRRSVNPSKPTNPTKQRGRWLQAKASACFHMLAFRPKITPQNPPNPPRPVKTALGAAV
ncbi:hypothetical protein AE621_15950 [Acidovorax sp. SD340]|nr:hypothetical protein AE621_15950 [Acidovorax sp. SD340]